METPLVETEVARAKEAFGGYAIECVISAIEHGGSATGVGALVMMGLLDATLEHFLTWHRAHGLPFDQAEFLKLVEKRLTLAEANVATFVDRPNLRVVQ
jgi:hypothetical protein